MPQGKVLGLAYGVSRLSAEVCGEDRLGSGNLGGGKRLEDELRNSRESFAAQQSLLGFGVVDFEHDLLFSYRSCHLADHPERFGIRQHRQKRYALIGKDVHLEPQP